MAISSYISEQKIEKRLEQLAQQITSDYQGEQLTIVTVLNGSFIFAADIVRKIKLPLDIQFISISSYEGTESTGKIKMNLDLRSEIEGKNVLIVEDIVDTGKTVKYLNELLKERSPKSLKLCSLLFKPARLEHKVEIDYLAFEIEDKFVVGYGLDYNDRYRELPYIGVYSTEEP